MTFKPRTWWTVFLDGEPIPWLSSQTRDGAKLQAVESIELTWETLKARGYTVGKITVTLFVTGEVMAVYPCNCGLTACNCDGTGCGSIYLTIIYRESEPDTRSDRAADVLEGMPCQCVRVKACDFRVVTTKCARCRALAILRG